MKMYLYWTSVGNFALEFLRKIPEIDRKFRKILAPIYYDMHSLYDLLNPLDPDTSLLSYGPKYGH